MTEPTTGTVPVEFLRGVIALCTQRGYSPENIEAWSTDDKWIADLWRQAAQMLAADPAQPAAQQGAAYAATPTSNYAGRVYEEGFLIGTCPLYTADQLRAFADATCALRASRGQAPAKTGNSVSAQADSVQEDACHAPPLGWRCTRKAGHEGPCAAVEYEDDKQFVERGMQRICDAEDAARYRLLRRGQHWSVIDGIGNDLRAEALDAAVDAARKQGGAT